MQVRLKPNFSSPDPALDFLREGTVCDAWFSEKPISPRPIVVAHPTASGVVVEVPYRCLEILPDGAA